MQETLIIRYLEQDHGIFLERKAVARNISFLREAGYTLILQYTDEHFRITPLVAGDEAAFRVSSLGIPEPDRNLCREAAPEEIDLILLPGIAFDRRGYRIGFGKGCYDQFLPAVPDSIPVMGLAYDFQIIDRVPEESHDRQADGIITPEQILYCRQRETRD